MPELNIRDFVPVTLADKETIRPLLLAEDVCFCDYNFANLFAWGDIFQTSWRLVDGRLWIYNGRDDLMLMPLGRTLELSELVAVSDGLRRQGRSGRFGLVGDDYIRENPDLPVFFEETPDSGNSDYVYSSCKLVDLRGNKLGKKRNQIRQFQALHPGYNTRPLRAGDLGACLELSEKWCRLKTCLELGFTHETGALKKALLHYFELELQGVTIILDGEMIAFSIFSPLNANTADVHFEKFDPLFKGSAQMINWETAKALAGTYKYINREQDLGLEGLRQAKRSYSPEYIVSAYRLERKD